MKITDVKGYVVVPEMPEESPRAPARYTATSLSSATS